MNELFLCAIMLDMFIVAFIQFVIMLLESQEVLNQEVKCLCSKTAAVLLEWPVPKAVDVSLMLFYCIRNKELCCMKCMHTVYKCTYTVHAVHIYSTGPYVH